jgi:three-Cys-motif partner protein
MDSRRHEFGNVSTDLKLSVVENYLKSFMKALRSRFIELWYIDAFAGTGERTVRLDAAPATFFDDETPEKLEQRKGSAQIAIDVKPHFDRLIFMDSNPKHCEALRALAQTNSDRRIDVLQGDANEEIPRMIKKHDWRFSRAVMFLDPYGMSVNWETLKSIRDTQAIDIWYLFSIEGLFRQAALDKSALNSGQSAAISRVLGDDDWAKQWYQRSENADLFGETRERRTATPKDMQDYVHGRLEGLFPKVLKPLTLRNDKGAPIFALFFAISNPEPKAIGLAARIANHILNSGKLSQTRPR